MDLPLRKRGHKITIYGPSGKTKQYKNYHEIGNTIEVPLPNGNWASVQMLKPFVDLKKIFTRDKFDILHVQEPYIPLLAWSLVEQIKIPKVSTFHSAWDNSSVINTLNSVLPLFKMKFSENMDASIFVSQITQKRWESICTKKVKKYVIYNAVDHNLFFPIKKKKSQTVKLLFLGRIVSRKGILYLLRAFNMIAKELPHVKLDIVGAGAETGNMIRYINRNNLEKQVTYRGEITGAKRVPYFQQADIFCAPYFDEASPLTILEAMSCGCTIVGFQNEAAKESLKLYPHYADLLVEQKNTKELAMALKKTILDQSLRQEIRKWCINESKKYSWDKVAKATEKVYYDVLRFRYA